MLHRVVKAKAILRRIIETLGTGEGVGAEIGKPGGQGNFIAEDEKLVEKVLHFIDLLKAAFRDCFPGRLAPRAIGFFLDAGHADEGLLLPVELDGQAATELPVLLCELRHLGFTRDIFVTVDFYLRFDAATKDIIKGRELREPRRLGKLPH